MQTKKYQEQEEIMSFINLPYNCEEIIADHLQIPKAAEFYKAILNSDYSHFISSHRVLEEGKENDEIIIFDTEPEVSQKPIYDIQYRERIAVYFDTKDKTIPWVYALREDFPLTSHLNSMPFEKPRSLCLYETPYSELKLSWRGVIYLERIRKWLSITSNGTLHQSNQPLEPFLLDNIGTIIIPDRIDFTKDLYVYLAHSENDLLSLVAYSEEKTNLGKQEPSVIIGIKTPPQLHGYLRKTPINLVELHKLSLELGIDLIEKELKPKLSNYAKTPGTHKNKVIFIFHIPKKRNESDDSPVVEYLTFISTKNLKEIAIACDAWYEFNGIVTQVIQNKEFEESKVLNIDVAPLSTYTTFTKEKALGYSNVEAAKNPKKLTLIGCGALGSQIFMNLTRMGIGQWTLIDKDILLPHNLARHALTDSFIGFPKSKVMAFVANNLLEDTNHSIGIFDNYLFPKDDPNITSALNNTDTIIDISASVAVSRKLAHDQKSKAKRISVFLNPNGNNLIILSENNNRDVTLDSLEAQYYRFISNEPVLKNHLSFDDNSRIRYSTSCRDISSRIGQDNLAILSGIATNHLKNDKDKSEISIWDINDTEVKKHSSEVFSTHSKKVNDWIIITDDYLLDKIHNARLNKLPNETGGILIGYHDMESKMIYVVDTILSPKDSHEYPTAYYRGIEGIATELDRIYQVTDGNLYYIGEWHSHPKNANLNPSEDDKILFKWLEHEMGKIGFPALMMILGDNKTQNILAEKI